MRKIYQLMLMVVILLSATIKLTAQVNGDAAIPLESTSEKPIYYYIESAADGTVKMGNNDPKNYLGHLIYAPNGSEGVQLKHDPKETITSASISLDNALWQIVKEDEVTKLKNKGTGLVLFDARFGKSDNTDDFVITELGESQYKIGNSNQTSPSVAWYSDANGNYLDRWSANHVPGSQVAWFFIVAPESKANYNELVNGEYLAQLLELIDNANAVLSSAISDGIVYTDENRASFKSKVDEAQAVYDNEDSTSDELISAKTTLEEAFDAFKETAVVNPELLLSANPQNYKWYWIRSTSTHAYASQKVISAGTRNAGDKFTFEDKEESPTDKQLFRVELNEDKTKIKSLINKTGSYMAADGSISETKIADNEFTLTVLSDGVSLRIKPASANDIHAREHNTDIVNWPGDAGSASAWSFDFALETPTSTKNLLDNTCVVRVNDGVITVDGVTEFDVYSIAGQKVNHKAKLLSGIYIVKVNDFTKKVIVK